MWYTKLCKSFCFTRPEPAIFWWPSVTCEQKKNTRYTILQCKQLRRHTLVIRGNSKCHLVLYVDTLGSKISSTVQLCCFMLDHTWGPSVFRPCLKTPTDTCTNRPSVWWKTELKWLENFACLSEGVMEAEQVCSLLVECWVDMPERLKADSRLGSLQHVNPALNQ